MAQWLITCWRERQLFCNRPQHRDMAGRRLPLSSSADDLTRVSSGLSSSSSVSLWFLLSIFRRVPCTHRQPLVASLLRHQWRHRPRIPQCLEWRRLATSCRTMPTPMTTFVCVSHWRISRKTDEMQILLRYDISADVVTRKTAIIVDCWLKHNAIRK